MSVNSGSRHDEDTRRRAAEMFGSGVGHKAVAGTLGLSASTVRKWHLTYRAIGAEGLLDTGRTHRRYDYETKLAAVRAVVEEGATKAQAMERFGIASRTPLDRWCEAYREVGAEAPGPRPKGRPPGSKSRPVEPTRERELERRVEKLEAESAYLKKSIALKAGKRSRTARRRRS
mgnify:CR=1 FL=1